MKLRGFALPILFLTVALVALLGERVVQPDQRPGRIKITYWEKWTGFEGDAIRAVVDDFNKSQDRIFVELLTVSNLGDKVLLSVAGGIPPDVAGLWGFNTAQYADSQALEPLDDYCRQYGIEAEDYVPVFWNMGFYKGRVYALPSTPASTALHYNLELFSKAGLDPQRPPKTIEELDAMADKLVVKDAQGRIRQSGFMPSEPGWWNWGWSYVFGGRLWDGQGKITITEPEAVRAYEWIAGYSKRYGPGELQTFRSGFGNFSSPQNAFMDRKVAMVLQGVWMYNFINMYQPELRWAAAPFPHPADRPDLAELTFADMDILVIPRGARHPKEAFEFIAYVQSQKAMEKLCLLQRKNSPLREVSQEFWDAHPNPYIRLFDRLSYSKNAVPPPKIGIWPEFQAELNNAFDNVMLLKLTPNEALSNVEARMQPKMDQYLARLKAREGRAR